MIQWQMPSEVFGNQFLTVWCILKIYPMAVVPDNYLAVENTVHPCLQVTFSKFQAVRGINCEKAGV